MDTQVKRETRVDQDLQEIREIRDCQERMVCLGLQEGQVCQEDQEKRGPPDSQVGQYQD